MLSEGLGATQKLGALAHRKEAQLRVRHVRHDPPHEARQLRPVQVALAAAVKLGKQLAEAHLRRLEVRVEVAEEGDGGAGVHGLQRIAHLRGSGVLRPASRVYMHGR